MNAGLSCDGDSVSLTAATQPSVEDIARVFPAASIDVEPDGPDACIVTTGADDPERMVLYLALPNCEFEILEPPEVIEAARRMGARLVGG